MEKSFTHPIKSRAYSKERCELNENVICLPY